MQIFPFWIFKMKIIFPLNYRIFYTNIFISFQSNENDLFFTIFILNVLCFWWGKNIDKSQKYSLNRQTKIIHFHIIGKNTPMNHIHQHSREFLKFIQFFINFHKFKCENERFNGLYFMTTIWKNAPNKRAFQFLWIKTLPCTCTKTWSVFLKTCLNFRQIT